MRQIIDYRTISQSVKYASQNIGQGKRYALLEGGYNHPRASLAIAVFCSAIAVQYLKVPK